MRRNNQGYPLRNSWPPRPTPCHTWVLSDARESRASSHCRRMYISCLHEAVCGSVAPPTCSPCGTFPLTQNIAHRRRFQVREACQREDRELLQVSAVFRHILAIPTCLDGAIYCIGAICFGGNMSPKIMMTKGVTSRFNGDCEQASLRAGHQLPTTSPVPISKFGGQSVYPRLPIMPPLLRVMGNIRDGQAISSGVTTPVRDGRLSLPKVSQTPAIPKDTERDPNRRGHHAGSYV